MILSVFNRVMVVKEATVTMGTFIEQFFTGWDSVEEILKRVLEIWIQRSKSVVQGTGR